MSIVLWVLGGLIVAVIAFLIYFFVGMDRMD